MIINQLSYFLNENGKITTDAKLIDCQNQYNIKFECELFFEFDNVNYNLRILKSNYQFFVEKDKNFTDNSDDFDLSNIFYSEVINYSHYAYNSRTMEFVDGLFHKNDAYQIPIVINPKRENDGWEGVIDINNENYLLQQRLLANILKESFGNSFSFRNMGDNMKAIKIKLLKKDAKDFSLFDNNTPPTGKQYNEDNEAEKLIFISDLSDGITINILFKKIQRQITNPIEILSEIKNEFNISEIEILDQYKLDLYLIYKTISICDKYPSFRKFLDEDGENFKINIRGFLEKMDDSHIFYKLKQAINFIKFYDEIWKNQLEKDEIILDIEDLSKILSKKVNKKN